VKTKSVILASVIFLILSITFALYWDKIYDGGLNEQKGEYIFYCLKSTIILTFFYLVLVRLSIRKLFPIFLLFFIPFITCIVSAIFAFIFSMITGKTDDVSILQLYLFINGFFATFFVFFVTHFTKKIKVE
jgi:hypothetical protein